MKRLRHFGLIGLLFLLVSASTAWAETNLINLPETSHYYGTCSDGPSSHDENWSTFSSCSSNPSECISEHTFDEPYDVSRLNWRIEAGGTSAGKYAHDVHITLKVEYSTGGDFVSLPEAYYFNHCHWDSGDDYETYSCSHDSGELGYTTPILGVTKIRAYAHASAAIGEPGWTSAWCRIYEIQAWGDLPTPTPTITPTQIPTPSLTPTPINGTLLGLVDLERPGISPPNQHWVVPIEVMLCAGGAVQNTYVATTDEDGSFSVEVESGVFDVLVKNGHTLANMRSSIVIPEGGSSSEIDFGILREGDANDDNYVTSPDFFILQSTYNLAEGDIGYDERADFNEDAMVTSTDFFLLKNHYNQQGDICSP